MFPRLVGMNKDCLRSDWHVKSKKKNDVVIVDSLSKPIPHGLENQVSISFRLDQSCQIQPNVENPIAHPF